jgi:tetratricopeptide (TPR) repeat protein
MSTDPAHAKVEDVERFLRNDVRPGSAPRNAQLVRHLLARCAPCRENLATVSKRTRSFDYGNAFAVAERSLSAYFSQGQPSAVSPETLFSTLSALPAEEQAERVASEPRYAHPSFVRHLIDASHAVRYQDPAGMLHLADLARVAAEACTAEAAGSAARLADLRAQAWRQYGNALRVLGRLREAEEALDSAQRLLAMGTHDPLLRARLCTQMFSLRYFQRRFDEAIELAEEAGQIYRELDVVDALASTLVQKAIAALYSGEAEDAVRTLNQAIPLIDPEGDPHLLLAACHNLVRCYIDLGRPEQALSIYFETRDLYKKFNDPLIRLRVAWQEGQLLRDLGHLKAAESLLLQARQGFVERDLLYDAAQISLDLAAVYVKIQAEAELKQTVSETIPIFRALGVDREVLALLLQLEQLFHQSRQALERIRFLNSRIEQLAPRQMPQ